MASSDMLKGYKVFSVVPRLKLWNGLRISGILQNWFVSMLSTFEDTWRYQYPYLKYDRTITSVEWKQRFT